MKARNFFALLSAAATLTLASCSKDNAPTIPATNFPADGVIRVATSVGAMQSRAGMTTDNITNFNLKIEHPTDAAYSYYAHMEGNNTAGWKSFVADGGSTPLQMLWRNSTDIVKVTALSKVATNYPDAGFTASCQAFVRENQTTENALKQSDILYMATQEVDPSKDLVDGKLAIAFKHLLSKLNLTITLGTELNITPGTAANPISNLKINGTYLNATFTPMTGVLTLETLSGIKPIQPFVGPYTAGAGTTTKAVAKYEAILVPQTIAAKAFTISFVLGGKVYEWKSPNAVTLATGTQYALDITVGKDVVTLDGFTSKEWTNGTGGNIVTE